MKAWNVVAALVLLTGASGVSAQALYKSVMPDGRVIYGDDPEYNAKQVGKVKPPPAKNGIVLPRSGASEQQRMMMSYSATGGGAQVAVLGGSSAGRRPSVRYCP